MGAAPQSLPAASARGKVRTTQPPVKPQGQVWIGKADFRLDRTPRAASASASADASSSGSPRRPHWRRGHWHTILHGEKRHRRRMQWFKPV